MSLSHVHTAKRSPRLFLFFKQDDEKSLFLPERLTPITTVTLSSLLQNAAPSIRTGVRFVFTTPRNRADSPSLFPCVTGTSNAELIPGTARVFLASLRKGACHANSLCCGWV
jgi:hypothetical protein